MGTAATGRKRLLFQFFCHLLAWMCYAGFIHGANFIANRNLPLSFTILFLMPLCTTFYVAVFFLNLRKERGIRWTIVSFFLVFVLMAGFAYLFLYRMLPLFGIQLYSSDRFSDFFKAALLGYVQYFSYALLYFYVRELIRKERRLRKVEEEKFLKELENARLKAQELQMQKDKLAAEFAFLRAQVNPHFLHNTLNVLFEQAMDCSEELADNILKLSKIMRYALEGAETTGDRVPVERELEQLGLLIDFHRMRFATTKLIRYTITGAANGQQVPPLSFISIVENAFKYGDLNDAEQPLTIQVVLRPGFVQFTCRNKKRRDEVPASSHSIGIANLRKRLEASFAGQYSIGVVEDQLLYSLVFTLQS